MRAGQSVIREACCVVSGHAGDDDPLKTVHPDLRQRVRHAELLKILSPYQRAPRCARPPSQLPRSLLRLVLAIYFWRIETVPARTRAAPPAFPRTMTLPRPTSICPAPDALRAQCVGETEHDCGSRFISLRRKALTQRDQRAAVIDWRYTLRVRPPGSPTAKAVERSHHST